MEATAYFIGRRTPEGTTFEWHGPEDGVLAMTDELLQSEDVLGQLPWNLVKIGHADPTPYWPGVTYFHRLV